MHLFSGRADKSGDRELELKRVIMADDASEEVISRKRNNLELHDFFQDGKEWYVIDSVWINTWLAYVHYGKDISPNPGPCDNTRLLNNDTGNSCWVPKPDMICATKTKSGHYRRITKETWEIFCECYPGSGPEIKMKYDPVN